jgi:addiction module HigA family antidote
MASDATQGWQPAWSVPPGEVLLEALEERGMTQSELARRTARPLKTINEIIKGKAAITADTAIQLERSLGISASFWTGLETRFRDQLAREQARAELEANASWIDGFPLDDLIENNLIRDTRSKADLLDQLLSFFRVSSPEGFERQWLDPSAAFRSSPAFTASPKAVAAWLRWGEIEASKDADLPVFDPSLLREILGQIRPLTRNGPFMQVLKKVQGRLREAGVLLLVMPEFKGTHLSGVTRWVTGRPVIQLNLRHKSEDHFWFTLYHEGGHLLTSSRRREHVDDMDVEFSSPGDSDEEAANQFARDCLLLPENYRRFVQAGDFSTAAVRAFAESQQIAAGIVVARLQRDEKLGRSQLNRLKQPLTWA